MKEKLLGIAILLGVLVLILVPVIVSRIRQNRNLDKLFARAAKKGNSK